MKLKLPESLRYLRGFWRDIGRSFYMPPEWVPPPKGPDDEYQYDPDFPNLVEPRPWNWDYFWDADEHFNERLVERDRIRALRAQCRAERDAAEAATVAARRDAGELTYDQAMNAAGSARQRATSARNCEPS